MSKRFAWLRMWAGLLLLPLLLIGVRAQEDDILETLLFEIEGVYMVDEDGVMTVDGVVLAPSEGLLLEPIANGTRVRVTGILLDDDTLQVVSMEAVLDEEADNVEDEVVEVTPEPEAMPEASARVCVPNTHPVANAIAEEFEVTVEEVIALHCAGEGFGNITRAYLLARALGGDVNAILAQRGGKAWRDWLAEANLRPQGLAPGRALSNRPDRKDKEGKTTGGRPSQAGGGNPNAGSNQGGGNPNAGGNANVGGGNPNAGGNQGGGNPNAGGRPSQGGGGNQGGGRPPQGGGNQGGGNQGGGNQGGGGGRPPQGGGRP